MIDEVIQQKTYPFYPIDSADMPLPGPDFLKLAKALGDEQTKIVTNDDGEKELSEFGPFLRQLYYDALYTPGFNINIEVKSRPVNTTFIRGHLWGYAVSGPRKAKVMLVGKWPGVEEVQKGRNFVGVPGNLTVKALEAAGIKRDSYINWYVTNVIKHPNLSLASNTASKAWIKNCKILLEEELRIVRPDFILALGAEAAKELVDSSLKLDSVQGEIFTKKIRINQTNMPDKFHEAKVMVCLHPARIIHQADLLPQFNKTISRFGHLIRGEELEKEEIPDHRVISDEYELRDIVDQVIAEANPNEQQIIAIDAEWHGEYPTEPGAWLRTIQFSHKPGFAACITLRKCGGADAFGLSHYCLDSGYTIEKVIARELTRLLVDTPNRKVRIAGHNLRADLPWVYHALDKDLGKALISQFTAPATPEDTVTAGGIDTMMAAHSVTEAPGEVGFKLEIVALNVCGIRRYDGKLQKWKNSYCKENNISSKALDGYGMCPDEVLVGEPDGNSCDIGVHVRNSYACWDADATRRLAESYVKQGGLLDCDQYGNCSRKPFWVSMGAISGFLEMEMTGLSIDKERIDKLTDVFLDAKTELLIKLRGLLNWPQFNPASVLHCRTVLFGYGLAGKIDKTTGEMLNIAPPGAKVLNLTPIKTSGKPSKSWEQVVRRNQVEMFQPSTDKEVLGILTSRLFEEDKVKSEIVGTLRYYRFANQVVHGMLREPLMNEETGLPDLDDNEERQYEAGLASFIHVKDGRVRTHNFPTKETGRDSTSRPSLQNLSKRREADYKKILGNKYIYPLRSVIQTTPGYVLVEADYLGAELAMMAIQSNDQLMIDHCMRANLPENDPKLYDIHSNLAVKAFKLTVNTEELAKKLGLPLGSHLPASKKAVKLSGNSHLRDIAKTLCFGLPYGRGLDAIIRAIAEEGTFVTRNEASLIKDEILTTYTRLQPYFDECESRVDTHGWIVNNFGRIRRFQKVDDAGEVKRQARNYRIQAGVADMINTAIKYLYLHPDRYESSGDLKYRLVLQMHDALVFEVKIPWLDWFIGTRDNPGILGQCMTNKIPIYTCDMAGIPLSDSGEYFMGIETAVMRNWGESIKKEVGHELGIPAIYCS